MPSEAQLIDAVGLLLDAHVSSILLAAQASKEAGDEVGEKYSFASACAAPSTVRVFV